MREWRISSLSNGATVFCKAFPLPIQGRFPVFFRHHHANSVLKHTQTQSGESPHPLPQRLCLPPYFQLLFIQNCPKEALVVTASLFSLLIPFSISPILTPSPSLPPACPHQSQHNLTLPSPVATASLSSFLVANDPGFPNSCPP